MSLMHMLVGSLVSSGVIGAEVRATRVNPHFASVYTTMIHAGLACRMFVVMTQSFQLDSTNQ